MPWKGSISFNHRCQEFILVLKSFCQEFLWIHFSPNIVSFQSRFVGYLEKVFTKLNGRLPASVSYRIKNIKIDAISGRGNVYSCNNILMENFSDYHSIWYNRKFSQQINHYSPIHWMCDLFEFLKGSLNYVFKLVWFCRATVFYHFINFYSNTFTSRSL